MRVLGRLSFHRVPRSPFLDSFMAPNPFSYPHCPPARRLAAAIRQLPALQFYRHRASCPGLASLLPALSGARELPLGAARGGSLRGWRRRGGEGRLLQSSRPRAPDGSEAPAVARARASRAGGCFTSGAGWGDRNLSPTAQDLYLHNPTPPFFPTQAGDESRAPLRGVVLPVVSAGATGLARAQAERAGARGKSAAISSFFSPLSLRNRALQGFSEGGTPTEVPPSLRVLSCPF